MNRKMLILSLSFSVLMAPAAFAADDLEKGIQAYESGNYAEALNLFKNACQAGNCSNPAAAHYYFANTLVKSHRLPSALVEYEQAYELDPIGKYGVYSKKVLQKFGVTPRVDTARLEAKAIADQQAQAALAAEKQKAAGESELNISLFASFDERLAAMKKADEAKARAAKAKTEQNNCCPDKNAAIDSKSVAALLPKIPSYKKESDPSIFLGQDVSDRTSKVTDSYDRRWRAADKVSEAKCLLENAEATIKAQLGDGKSQDKVTESLLKPYRQYLSECETNLKREDGILESCNRARQSGEAYWPF